MNIPNLESIKELPTFTHSEQVLDRSNFHVNGMMLDTFNKNVNLLF